MYCTLLSVCRQNKRSRFYLLILRLVAYQAWPHLHFYGLASSGIEASSLLPGRARVSGHFNGPKIVGLSDLSLIQALIHNRETPTQTWQVVAVRNSSTRAYISFHSVRTILSYRQRGFRWQSSGPGSCLDRQSCSVISCPDGVEA